MGLLAPPLSLYVHFPWCVRKCPYCDFNSYTLQGELPERVYLEALERDMEAQAQSAGGRALVSVFLGGGTPSLFSPGAIERVLGSARERFVLQPGIEVTLEANPGTVERGRFAEYRAAGVTRVSLGAQSFDGRQLETLGRIHSAAETCAAAAELHAAGLTNFNMDLMYALPGQDVAAALADLEQALALDPAHLSHYQLTIEAGTVFAARPPVLPQDETAAEIGDACEQRLSSAGFERYEVSAFALPQRRCQHNLNYWEFGDYLGVGAGAHGKLSFADSGTVVRTAHPRDPRRYIAAAAQLRPSKVPPAELPFEFMLNGLRLVDGFAIQRFSERTGCGWSEIDARVGELERRGLLAREKGWLRPTALGLRFLNDALLHFVAESPKTSGGFGMSTSF